MKKKLLAFARLLKCFQEVNTDRGVLIADSEIQIDTEVFILNEEGELVPATSGKYETEDKIYIVEGSKVVSIELKEEAKEEIIEEPIQEEVVVEVLEEEVVEEPIEEPIVNEELEALKVENEELKATIEELKKEIEDLKKQLELPVADAIEEQTTVFSTDKKRNAKLEALAKAFNK
jgi:predicted RNase H-like nuclease (RuvC/YqgF family)